jgi:hypothetical protein
MANAPAARNVIIGVLVVVLVAMVVGFFAFSGRLAGASKGDPQLVEGPRQIVGAASANEQENSVTRGAPAREPGAAGATGDRAAARP